MSSLLINFVKMKSYKLNKDSSATIIVKFKIVSDYLHLDGNIIGQQMTQIKKVTHLNAMSYLMEPLMGLEPTTYSLQVNCSTN